MGIVKFDHKRSAVLTNCGPNQLCQVVLDKTSPIKKAKQKDKLRFDRVGPDNDKGFKVTIAPPFSNGDTFTCPAGDTRLEIDVPEDQLDRSYEYKIYYDNDTGYVVAPLDPIIIIQPPTLKAFAAYLLSNMLGIIVSMAVGFSFAMTFFR